MNIITIDFETYYDSDYTLKKLTTEEYVRDPRFQVLGCGVIYGSRRFWLSVASIKPFLASLPSDAAFLCHHAHFDGLILSHHFNTRPAIWLDTLSMARYMHGNSISNSLDNLTKYYSITTKNMPYGLFKGKHWHDLTHNEQEQVAQGCITDCVATRELFDRMIENGFPLHELPIIDSTVRMFTEPRLIGDTRLFDTLSQTEIQQKQALMDGLGVTRQDLQSAEKFCALLTAEGVEIEYKEGKNGPIPAIARTDSFMQSLLNDKNETISTLADARLAVKSTIIETRASRLSAMSARGSMAVYIYYCGAHTRRFSGGDATNFQNLNRGADIRKGLRAPEGTLLATPDQSQGECRILNWFAGQLDVVERFRQGADPYVNIASKFYGFKVTKEHPKERGTGKQLELSCGYGAGASTIQRTAARGTYGPPVYLSNGDSERAKDLYRSEHKSVVALWDEAREVLAWLTAKREFSWRILHGERGRLFHPNGSWLDYTGLRWDSDNKEWKLKSRNGEVRTYGAKLVENVVQWLSRIVTCEAMETFRQAELPIVGMAHDDVWLLIPADSDIEEWRNYIGSVMSATPQWAHGLPMASDVKIGETYL